VDGGPSVTRVDGRSRQMMGHNTMIVIYSGVAVVRLGP